MKTPPSMRPLALLAIGALAALSCSQDRSGPTGPAASPSFASQAAQQQGLATAIAAQERHNPQLLATSGVEGTAVGLTADGRPTVLVFTRAASVTGMPQSLDGVPVTVQVTGPFTALRAAQTPVAPQAPPPGKGPGNGHGHGGATVDPTTRWARPVPIGVSTGNAGECSAGTISARVTKGGDVFALSNNHVYALENTAPLGSEVLQPGLYDTNCAYDANNHLGTLFEFSPIDFSSGGSNTIDAAIAATTRDDLGNATPSNGYGVPSSTTTGASVGQAVQKYGRSTSLTTGSVTGINATITVGYTSGTTTFVDQIIVQSQKPFIKAGDSGSLLVTNDGAANPVGLLFAGNQSGKYAVANRIDLVLAYFGVTIDGK